MCVCAGVLQYTQVSVCVLCIGVCMRVTVTVVVEQRNSLMSSLPTCAVV